MGGVRRDSPSAAEADGGAAPRAASGPAGTALDAGAVAAARESPEQAAGLGVDKTMDGALAATVSGSAAAAGPAASGSVVSVGGLRAALRVGRYLILRQVGAGGMGVVFAAYDEELDRKVAVKLLRQAGDARSDLRVRIMREAQAMARLSHPNVVQIYEIGEIGETAESGKAAGQVFIAMEFIEGKTLSEWQRPRGWEEVLPVYLQAGQGLRAAHESGLIHRDFKPDNVLVGSDGRPRVADFGLARVREADPADPVCVAAISEMSAESLLVTPLTQDGAILGTPAYMSPEQYRGEPTDSSCDQFSFCAALYEGLYKTLPFAGQTLAELRHNVLAGNIRPPPPRSTVPHKVDAALRRGLATDPAARFASMSELLAALAFDPKHDPGAEPWSRKLFSRTIAGLLFLIVLAMFPVTRRGEVTALQVMGASLLFLAVGGGAAFFVRRTLLANYFHRGTVFCLLLFVVQQVCIHGLAAISGLTARQVLPIELVCLAATGATLSYFLFHSGWLMQPLLLGAALLTVVRPQNTGMVTLFIYPVTMMYAMFLWGRAARSHKAEEPVATRR
ncbi:MAG TPA: serine/threonine-protein kinase [Pseudomonadota bacterium]|nr:serine/threonine-protein kinase [Pseudomonadota bacterium]